MPLLGNPRKRIAPMEEVPLGNTKNDTGAESFFIYGLLLATVLNLFSLAGIYFIKGLREDSQKRRMFLFGVGAGIVVQVTIIVGARWFILNRA